MTLSCGHPDEALEYGLGNAGDPVGCGWCAELKQVRDEANARAARVVRLFSEIAHEHPMIDWGNDASGIHGYTPNEPAGCPVCEALDAVLGDARNTLDVMLTGDQRDAIRSFRESGLLWLVNTSVMHPRGYAISVTYDKDGHPVGMSIEGDGSEPWCFGMDAEDSFAAHVRTEQEREAEWSRLLNTEGRAERGG